MALCSCAHTHKQDLIRLGAPACRDVKPDNLILDGSGTYSAAGSPVRGSIPAQPSDCGLRNVRCRWAGYLHLSDFNSAIQVPAGRALTRAVGTVVYMGA